MCVYVCVCDGNGLLELEVGPNHNVCMKEKDESALLVPLRHAHKLVHARTNRRARLTPARPLTKN